MTTVGAHEAQSQFAQWLLRVERGEEVVITRDGSPIARLVPVEQCTQSIDRQAAIAELRQLASRNRLGDIQVKDLVAEGRR